MNRRAFTGRTVMAGASLALPGMLRAGQENGAEAVWRPRPALSSVMFSQLSLAAFCARAQNLGFQGIDLWGPFDKCRHLYEAVELGADGFRKLLERHGLQVGAWTTYRHKKHDKAFPDFAEFIGACGGGIVVRGTQYEGTAKDQLEGSIIGFYEKLAPEIDLARKHKVRIALENHAHAILNNPLSFELFTKHNPAPDVVGFAIAPYHLQHGKADVAEVIRKHGDRLLFFYAWQLADGTKQLPGHGPTDFRPWLKALSDIGYRHWMTPFMHGELPEDEMSAAVAKSLAYLKNPIDPQP